MIRETNAWKGASESEKVNILLSTDQSSSSPLIGAVITIAYGSYSKEYIWEGVGITVSVPDGVKYTVSFSEVDEYEKPSSSEYIAKGGNSRTVTGEYILIPTTDLSKQDIYGNTIAQLLYCQGGWRVQATSRFRKCFEGRYYKLRSLYQE